jgi:hypothetical protein
MKTSIKTLSAIALTVAGLSAAQAAETHAFVYGGNVINEPARTAAPTVQLSEVPAFVYPGEVRAAKGEVTARKAYQPTARDIAQRALAFIG